MAQLNIEIFPHPSFLNRATQFQKKYNLVNILVPGDQKYSRRNLRSYSSRTCRFCGLSYPNTPFSNYSHLLPQMIGNTNLYSDFECDKCNETFSRFENDLAGFLGVSRSITGLSGEKQATGFSGRKIGVKSRSFVGDNILIIAPEDAQREGTTTTLTYLKNSFTPANVYKALLKCALSLLKEEEIRENYTHAIDYLSGRGVIMSGAVISGYQLSFKANMPLHVYIFHKKVLEDHVPTYVMCFYFQNHIITFPIPFDEVNNAGVSEQDIILPPPYFANEDALTALMPVPFIRDMCSIDKVEDEEDKIIIQVDPESLTNLSRYDPVTDTHEDAEYNLDIPKYIILTKDGVTIDPKNLSAFIKKQMEGK